MGTIVSIAYNPVKGLPRPLHDAARLERGHGIVGDHRAGARADRALNILDQRHVEALAAAGYAVVPGSLGENLLIADLDLDALPVGSRLRLGDTVVARITDRRNGCLNLRYIHPDFPEASTGRVGQMCAVEVGGEIRVGDEVVLLQETLPVGAEDG
jgi:MOSC domain-containing protein YiiM